MSKYESWLQSAPHNLEPAKLWKLFVESYELTQSERWQEFNLHFNRIHCPDKWRPYAESKNNFSTETKSKKR